MANLTKWACFGDGMMYPVKDRADKIQGYVKFEDIKELLKSTQPTDLQQLMADSKYWRLRF